MEMSKTTLLAVIFAAASNCIFNSVTAFTPPPPPRAIPSSVNSSPPLSAASKGSNTVTTTNVNFDDWIANAPTEIAEWKICPVDGKIPSYVQGTLIRNGGGAWSVSNGEMYSHIFDGLAKIHAYRINSGTVEHQARFLKGKWYNKYMELNKQQLPAGIGTGPVLDANGEPKADFWSIAQATAASVTIFDNTPVNIWDYSPSVKDPSKKKVTALTDAPPRTTIDFHTMNTSSSSTINTFASGSKGYELLITAHPQYSQNKKSSASSVDSYNVAVELGLDGARINLVKENSEGERSVTASFGSDDGKIPYMHSFGLSKRFATIVLQPLRLNVAPDKLISLGFLRSMEHIEHTRVVLIELATGKVVLDKTIDEKVYFYHSISQAETLLNDEENGDAVVSLRLCAYETPDQLTGEHQFMRLEQCRKGRDWRNKLHKGGKFCDLVCNISNQSVQVEWNDQITQGFELPITRYSRTYNGELPPSLNSREQQAHPRYVYSFGAYAMGSPDYDNWGLFKFDLEENKIDSYYLEDSVYLSEPLFVPDPDGSNEDDGVLLSQVYFGREQETKLLVIDATNMKVLAEVSTGNRAPLDFHGAWIPS